MVAMVATGHGLRATGMAAAERRRKRDMTEETYSRPDVDRAIEAAFRLGFGNALAEVDGDLHPFGHGRRRRCCAHARYWRTRRPSFRTAATPRLRRRLSRLWKPSRNTRNVGNDRPGV